MILVSLLKQRCIILYAFVNIKNKSLLKQKKKKKQMVLLNTAHYQN